MGDGNRRLQIWVFFFFLFHSFSSGSEHKRCIGIMGLKVEVVVTHTRHTGHHGAGVLTWRMVQMLL